MAMIRLLVLWLFLGSCNAIFALPEDHDPSDETANLVSSAETQKQNDQYFHAVVLNSLNSLFVDGSESPTAIFAFLKNDDQWSCAHTNAVALLYMVHGEAINLNFDSFSITYPFHSFP